MCSKTLATLYDNHIEDEPGNPGWLNFFALDADKKYLRDIRSVEVTGDYPPTVSAMHYLGAEDPKKNDFVLFLLCSTKGELGPRP